MSVEAAVSPPRLCFTTGLAELLRERAWRLPDAVRAEMRQRGVDPAQLLPAYTPAVFLSGLAPLARHEAPAASDLIAFRRVGREMTLALLNTPQGAALRQVPILLGLRRTVLRVNTLLGSLTNFLRADVEERAPDSWTLEFSELDGMGPFLLGVIDVGVELGGTTALVGFQPVGRGGRITIVARADSRA